MGTGTTDLEYIPCNLCAKDDYSIVYKSEFSHPEQMRDISYGYRMDKGHYMTGRIVRCNNCGLRYVNPRQRGVEDSYINNGEDISYLTSMHQRILNAEKDLRLLERFKKGRRLLDVGCSCGVFLEIAKRKGLDVYGVDLSPWACNLANKKGLEAFLLSSNPLI